MKMWKYLFILIPGLIIAQVNTEKLRAENKEGLSGKISLGYGMASGNSEYLSFTPSARIDYTTKKYISFIAGSYNRKQSELKKGSEFLLAHKGFAHVRSARKIWPLVSWEVFGQWEFNEFISLKRRILGGTGARINLLHSMRKKSVNLFLGVGGMYEHEIYNVEKENNLLRSTNYVSLMWQFSEQGSFQTTGYYQVAATEPEDFRIISDSSLKFKLASWLVFGTSMAMRFDNDPVAGVEKKYDIELSNDLMFEF